MLLFNKIAKLFQTPETLLVPFLFWVGELRLQSVCYFHRKTKDSTTKLSQMKRNQQTEKKNSAQMLEEARQRENQMTDDMAKMEVRKKLCLER